MATSPVGKGPVRRRSGRIGEVIPMPHLLCLQRDSYQGFLQPDTPAEQRTDSGLQKIFSSVFPITVSDAGGRAELDFVSYDLKPPRYDVAECCQRGFTYAAPLKVKFRLSLFSSSDGKNYSLHSLKEQELHMGEVPLMTEGGSFVISGSELVVVAQMHRSPGVFFDHDKGKKHASDKLLFSAHVIPYRGSWLDFDFDAKDIIHVRIDRRNKLPITTLLYALVGCEQDPDNPRVANWPNQGISRQEVLEQFYPISTYLKRRLGKTNPREVWECAVDLQALGIGRVGFDLVERSSNKIVVQAGESLTPCQLSELKSRLSSKRSQAVVRRLTTTDLEQCYAGEDIVDKSTGAIYAEAGDSLGGSSFDDVTIIERIAQLQLNTLRLIEPEVAARQPYILNTMAADRNSTREEALADLYRVIRPNEPSSPAAAERLFRGLFSDPDRYDLSEIGRIKLNERLGLEDKPKTRTLRKADILRIVQLLIELRDGRGGVDDIDHLGNRRVRAVGELLENQYRNGLMRIDRVIRERLQSHEGIALATPSELVNAKPVAAAVREFFNSSVLSQFMDQTNPLAEITHKRRLSSLGPGGLTRDRAGFEVRDVRPTHYGRICPVETPEGHSIGLINSLATYARVDRYGFIESPYRRVRKGQVTNEVVYLSAMEEERYAIAQANVILSKRKWELSDLVTCRRGEEYLLVPMGEVDFIDVSPKQLMSVATSLIPFLENDDANRALMGSNMQRQAVPLLQARAPLVGTGLEETVARDSGVTVIARRTGVVDRVDASRIVIRVDGDTSQLSAIDIYNLIKFRRSNQGTCISQRPLVKAGQQVTQGEVIADSSSTHLGELALGSNVLVAFMSWHGHNFEDSILISERLVHDDVFTSIHIEEFEAVARDTKQGQEEITRDIPNVGEESLRNLDESGIIYVGAEVKARDILVGKVTPKSETSTTPEERLLRAIFGEKASDVRDSCLRAPPGTFGTVVEVRVFSRRGVEKDDRSKILERQYQERLDKDHTDKRAAHLAGFQCQLKLLLVGQRITGPAPELRAMKLASGAPLTEQHLEAIEVKRWRKLKVADPRIAADIERLKRNFDSSIAELEQSYGDKLDKLQGGDDLPPGVMKVVKVFVAVKRKLQPGDKMAGRHGNKGVVSTIVPVEDMPYLEDGRPVDIVLNPLGVPSRMNVGQILETHLGWALAGIGRKIGSLADRLHSAIDVKRSTKAVEAEITESRAQLLALLQRVYGTDLPSLAAFGDEELLTLAQSIRSGVPVAMPVFDSIKHQELSELLELAGLDRSGQVTLIDGRSGEPFSRKVTVGWKYIMKLHHLVDEKIHARSVGPYSLVTQQPLSGKAHFGGQRLGEMEVWALQAYGAAYTLQEMVTVKSDDVEGRNRAYSAIVHGSHSFNTGIPESFNVLVRELRSLGLEIEQKQDS